MAVPEVGSGSAAEEASGVLDAASEEAARESAASLDAALDAMLDALDAGRSRLRTTVYQVWVAQSRTWGAATHAAASTAITSTAMPIPFLTRISRL